MSNGQLLYGPGNEQDGVLNLTSVTQAVIPTLWCPTDPNHKSNGNSGWSNDAGVPGVGFFGNYLLCYGSTSSLPYGSFSTPPNGIFFPKSATSISSITDEAPSNTVLAS